MPTRNTSSTAPQEEAQQAQASQDTARAAVDTALQSAPVAPIPAKPFDVYAIVPDAVHRKSTKNTFGSKFIAANRPRLTEDDILDWADAHFASTGEWPKRTTPEPIPESPESTWANIDGCLRTGRRGLLGDSSLPLLLWQRRGVRNHMVVPDFTVEEILTWADAFHACTGEWPTMKSGPVAEAPDESWQIVNTALRVGVRGLPGGVSLPQLLAQERGYRNVANPPPLTEDMILEWADAYFERTGKWPCAKDGIVQDVPDESWVALNGSLINGIRGLAGGSSLAQLLAAKRGKYVPRLRTLMEAQILAWADAYFERTGEWPTCRERGHDPIPEASGETWQSVNLNLRQGRRGLPGGGSLARLLAQERGRRRLGAPELLTEAQILQWADAHFARTGDWPVVTYKRGKTVNVVRDAPHENWGCINSALRAGGRGLPGEESLAQFLLRHRGKPVGATRGLSVSQILEWADAHFKGTGQWPNNHSGLVQGAPGETWAAVNGALRDGCRGLPGGGTLAGLLVQQRGLRVSKHLCLLTIEQILAWADAHLARTGIWPVASRKPGSRSEEYIPEAPGESWKAVNAFLRSGSRGLPQCGSLAQLLAEHRGKKLRAARTAPLSVEQILGWARTYVEQAGKWPTKTSGFVAGTDGEEWSAVSTALEKGCRGLPGGDSLARLLEREWGQRNPFYRTPLTEAQILGWADAHFARTGQWPVAKNRHGAPENRIPEALNENWGSINGSLHMGERGLPGGGSLARLLAEHRGKVLPPRRTTPLSIVQILSWAQAHHEQTGRWPNKETGEVTGTDGEAWAAINTALSKGGRGLPGGSSLSQLLETHLGKPAQVRTTALSEEQIFLWAKAHQARTGRWPNKESGAVEGSEGEVWSSLNTALRRGKRGLPGGSNLAQCIQQQERRPTKHNSRRQAA